MRIDRVTTKTGDDGFTALIGGQRVPKEDLRVEAYGTVDELNSTIGLVRMACRKKPHETTQLIDQLLTKIQHQLFDMGGELACNDPNLKLPFIEGKDIVEMEQLIEQWTAQLPPLKSFILPGGGEITAFLHLARTVCRRAERFVFALSRRDPLRSEVPIYLNRLSDFLFVVSRKIAQDLKETEEMWLK
ncbi:MAG: cob(I)yrinic acid a,c-diamide adenosyltransferase [Planctomycetota bacterium]